MTTLCKSRRCAAVLVTLTLTAPVTWPAESPNRPASQQEYWAQFDRRDWDSAVRAAQALVESARAGAAKEPLQLAEALSLLGNAQLGKTDYVNAEAAYAEALGIVERHAGSASGNLLDPLRGMGYTLAATGRHEEAVLYLDRALLIAHRSYGLFDINQQGILRQLTASLTKVGRLGEAEKHIAYLMRVGERVYGNRDPRFAAVLCTVGDWYTEVGNFGPARVSYRSALGILERKLGKSDPAVVEPLRSLARSYTHELYFSTIGIRTREDKFPSAAPDITSDEQKVINPRYISADGERALERALKVLEAHADAPKDALIETLVQLGDWHQVKQQPDIAMTYYRRAAAMLPDVAAAAGGAKPGLLHFPVRIYYQKPLSATRNLTLAAELVEEKFVQVEFTVTSLGLVEDAKVTDKNGSSRQASDTLEAIRDARFRPRFVDGQPADTPAMIHREVFKIRKPIVTEKE